VAIEEVPFNIFSIDKLEELVRVRRGGEKFTGTWVVDSPCKRGHERCGHRLGERRSAWLSQRRHESIPACRVGRTACTSAKVFGHGIGIQGAEFDSRCTGHSGLEPASWSHRVAERCRSAAKNERMPWQDGLIDLENGSRTKV